MPTTNSLGAPAPAPERAPAPPRPRRLPQPGKDTRRAWWWGAAVLLIVAGAAAWWQKEAFLPGRPKAATPLFRTVKASTGTLQKSVRLTGTTAAEKFTVLMGPQLRGSRSGHGGHEFTMTLERVAPSGSMVRKGDEVAEFDRQYMLRRMEDFQATVDQHERNVTRLRAYLAIRRAAYEQLVMRAKGTMEKVALDLKKIPILSANLAERYRLDYEEAKRAYEEVASRAENVEISEGSAVRRAELDYKQTQLEYQRAQRYVDRLLVRAPMEGMVVMMTTRRSGERGQIQAGDQIGAGQPYMHIVDLRNMVVDANVNQVDAQDVRLGMEARVRFDAYPELELPAEVVAVGAFAVQTGWRGSFVRTIPIRLKLDRTDPLVIPDLSVSADLLLDKTENATLVPREAVFGEGDEHFAFVRAGTNWEKRPVEVVGENHTTAAIGSGVSAGDVLAAEIPPAHGAAADTH